MEIVRAGLLGLMFRKEGLGDKALLFDLGWEAPCLLASIHTFFCHFPVDLVWFDKNKEVIDMRKGVCPWSFAVPRARARYVLEFEHDGREKTYLNEEIIEMLKKEIEKDDTIGD